MLKVNNKDIRTTTLSLLKSSENLWSFDDFRGNSDVLLMSLSLKVTSATKQQLLKMCHLRHRLRMLLFRRKIMFRSQDIQVFLFLTIPWFTESVTSRWVLVHETSYIFEYIFWTTTHGVTKCGQLIDLSKGNNFQ